MKSPAHVFKFASLSQPSSVTNTTQGPAIGANLLVHTPYRPVVSPKLELQSLMCTGWLRRYFPRPSIPVQVVSGTPNQGETLRGCWECNLVVLTRLQRPRCVRKKNEQVLNPIRESQISHLRPPAHPDTRAVTGWPLAPSGVTRHILRSFYINLAQPPHLSGPELISQVLSPNQKSDCNHLTVHLRFAVRAEKPGCPGHTEICRDLSKLPRLYPH
jgi:hypothetical protein